MLLYVSLLVYPGYRSLLNAISTQHLTHLKLAFHVNIQIFNTLSLLIMKRQTCYILPMCISLAEPVLSIKSVFQPYTNALTYSLCMLDLKHVAHM
jgi:hypothetical protein